MLTAERVSARQLTPAQSLAVRAELRAVLDSESFSSSQRCRDFLESVVALALAGDYESLTERFLGVKLFGRSVDYETATDSIVRVRANDVRRRLMQHYSTPRPECVVRIEMTAGGYIPNFSWISSAEQVLRPDPVDASQVLASPVADNAVGSQPTQASTDEAPLRRAWSSRGVLIWGGFALLLAGVSASFFAIRAGHRSNFDLFWQPLLDASAQPVINLPTTDTFQLVMNPKRTLSPLNDLHPGESLRIERSDIVSFHDWHVSLPVLQATLSVALALERKGQTPLVRMGTDLRRDEIRGHPMIAIGSFSNPWTEETVTGLRFTFDRGVSDQEAPSIRDALNPQRSWSLPHIYPEPQQKDYAIITRTFDPVTHEPFVSLAGLHSFGNQIAAEFVSQEATWNEVARHAPHGWEKMNLQILLEADIVGTTPGSPKVVDLYFWK